MSATVTETLKEAVPAGGVPLNEKVELENFNQPGVSASALTISDPFAAFPSK